MISATFTRRIVIKIEAPFPPQGNKISTSANSLLYHPTSQPMQAKIFLLEVDLELFVVSKSSRDFLLATSMITLVILFKLKSSETQTQFSAQSLWPPSHD